MEGGVGQVVERPVCLVDAETPRQVRWAAEHLLVEPVPPPADGLGDGKGRDDRVEHDRQVHAAPAGDQRAYENAGGQAARDAEPTLPDGEHVLPAALEPLPVRCHVVQPRPDQAGGHRPHRNRRYVVGMAAPRHPPPRPDHHGGHHAQADHQAIGAQLDRTQVHRARRRAGNGCEQRVERHDRLHDERRLDRQAEKPSAARAKRSSAPAVTAPSCARAIGRSCSA